MAHVKKSTPPLNEEETRSLLAARNKNADQVVNDLDKDGHGSGMFSQVPMKAFLLAAAGNFFEYYDFGLLGYFTDEIGDAFFPSGSDELYTLEVFTLFAVGFIFRPFGGALFGYIGDKMGRAKALRLAIIMMSLPTFLTGCIPTYDMIGWAAPVILCILRILQGLSQGGEVSSSYVFVYEVSPKHQRAFFLSIMGCSSFGSLLASAMHVFFSAVCTTDQLYSWGWRIPFFFGIILAFLAIWAKKELKTNDEYQIAQERIQAGEASQATLNLSAFENPLVTAFSKNFGVILLFLFGGAYQHAANYIVWTFLPDYIADSTMHNGYSDSYAYVINCINIILSLPVSILAGYYTDILKNKKQFLCINLTKFKSPILLYIGYCITIIVSPLLWYGLSQSTNAWTDWFWQLLIGLHFQIIWGCIYYWYIDLLLPEKQTRVSLYGVGYNTGAAVFSGTASLIATALVDVLGSVTGAVCTGLWLSTLGLSALVTVIYVDFYFEFKHSGIDRNKSMSPQGAAHHGSIKGANNDENDYNDDEAVVAI